MEKNLLVGLFPCLFMMKACLCAKGSDPEGGVEMNETGERWEHLDTFEKVKGYRLLTQIHWLYDFIFINPI